MFKTLMHHTLHCSVSNFCLTIYRAPLTVLTIQSLCRSPRGERKRARVHSRNTRHKLSS